jgi:phosphoribosylanthranilate isomerase
MVHNKPEVYTLRIKICGITNPEDALICEELGADALGFIFYEKSKRYIAPEKVRKIIKNLSPFIVKTGVFVNENPNVINEIALTTGLNVVQLHGDENPESLKEIKFPIIKSFRINNGFDSSILTAYKNATYLFDSYLPAGQAGSEIEYGGTGKTFDWKLIPGELKSKIILSGGIASNNIEEIYKNIKPAAVDLSSSLESEPGKKKKEKVEEFFKKINYLRR